MPFRQLPATDAARGSALTAALKKSTGLPAADNLMTPETAAALATFAPQWEKEITERADALGRQTAATATLDLAGSKLRQITSHFIQVFHLAVARGTFSPSGRASYGLDVNEETTPALDAEADLLLWADRIVKGDPRRVTNFSEPAMAMPTAAEVSTALTAYNTELARQTAAKDTLEAEQADVIALRAGADTLIRDAWDEIEISLRKLDPPNLRRRAREWGVFYALRPGEPAETTTPEPPTPQV